MKEWMGVCSACVCIYTRMLRRPYVHATTDALSSLRNFEYINERLWKLQRFPALDSIVNDLEKRIARYGSTRWSGLKFSAFLHRANMCIPRARYNLSYLHFDEWGTQHQLIELRWSRFRLVGERPGDELEQKPIQNVLATNPNARTPIPDLMIALLRHNS